MDKPEQEQLKEYRAGPTETVDDIRLALQELIAGFNEIVRAVNKLVEKQ